LEDALIDDTEQVELQLWKYDPQILAKGSTVDVLSLAMCFWDDPDERVEEAVEEMLEEYWRNTNGWTCLPDSLRECNIKCVSYR
jgi:hypothetical protein